MSIAPFVSPAGLSRAAPLSRARGVVVRLALAALLATLPARGAVRAQDADPVTGLLDRIQDVASRGDRAAFRAMAAPDAAGDALTRFATRWLSSTTTAATLRERERSDLAGGGQRVLVEALVAAGGTGRVATWRFDLEPEDAGWRIRDVATLGAVEGLYRLALDDSRQWRAHDLVVRAEDFELRLPAGDVFLAEASGAATAAVLLGRGEMIFTPAPETERRQLQIFAGSETLRTSFDVAFLRFRPEDASRRLPSDQLTTTEVDPGQLARAQRVFAEESIKSFVVDLADLSAASWSLLPSPGDLVAEVRTGRYDTLTYLQSSADAEDVGLFDRRRRKNIASYTSKARLAARGRAYDEDDAAIYDVLDYDVNADFTPHRSWLQGTTRMRLRIRAASTSSLSVRLSDSLVPHAVTSNRFGRMLYLRVLNQNRLVINLPESMTQGQDLSLSISYAGRIEPQSLDREALQIDQQQPQEPPRRFEPPPLVIQPQPAWLYSNRSDWYPQAPISDYATATIRLTVPDDFGAVCSGAPASGSPVTIRTNDGGTKRLFAFGAASPIPYLACAIARFREEDDRTAAEAVAAPAGPGTTLALRLMDGARDRGRSRSTLEHARRIAEFYGSIVGEIPYPRLTLATVESYVPGGHAPAYMVVLRQPIPQTPFVWGDDPASFEGFEDFFLAHELAHQWWGQAVGWENYHEQWLSEGFAQYFAALYAEHDRGAGTFRDILRRLVRWTRSDSDEGPVSLGYRVGHLRSDPRAFRAIVYNKGAIVLHMLRLLAGDEAFFDGVRRYYRAHRFSKAGTGDLRTAMEQASGQSLSAFFDQWVYGQALPTVHVDWTAEADALRLNVRQASAFTVPLPVTLVYADGTRTQTIAALRDAQETIDLPLSGPLRTAEFNADGTVPVDVRD